MRNLYLLYGEALASPSEDVYVAEWATSSIFDADTDGDAPDYDGIVTYLQQIWTAAHISIKDIRARLGLSQAEFSRTFCIPKRTVENWESTSPGASRECPSYVRLMLAQLAGIVNIIRLD